MSRLNPTRRKPLLPYWLCVALWATMGPLGAAPAACRHWKRACLEAALTLGGLQALFSSSLLGAPLDPPRAWLGAGLLALSSSLWIGDFWRMRAWHGRKFDPLLDSTTEP